MRKIVLALTAAVLALSVAPAASAETGDQPESTALERVRAYVAPSIVNLQISWSAYVWDSTAPASFVQDISTGEPQQFQLTFQCTGFVVNPDGYVATAGHCVNPNEVREDFYQAAAQWAADCGCYYSDTTLSADTIYGFSSSWTLKHYDKESDRVKTNASLDGIQAAWPVSAGGVEVGQEQPARVVKYQDFENGDGALLKVDATGLPALPLVTGDPEIGSHVVAVGFPGSVDDVTDPDLEPSYKDGSLGSQSTENGGLTTVYEISAATSGGMSGGPVVNDDGEVLGFVDFKNASETQAFNFMRPASTITELFVPGSENTLDDNATAYREGLTAYFEGDKATAVAKLGAVVEAQPTNKYATDYLAKAKELPDPPKSKSDSGSNAVVLVLAGVGVVIVLGAVGALVLARRRRTPRPGAGMPVAPYGGMPYGPPTPAAPVPGADPARPAPVAQLAGAPAGFRATPPADQATVVAAGVSNPPGLPVAACGRCGTAKVDGQRFCGSCGTAY